jgi:hypothetical protein
MEGTGQFGNRKALEPPHVRRQVSLGANPRSSSSSCSVSPGATAQSGKPAQALAQLRYYTQHATPGQDGSETDKIIESRYVVAQLLATGGEPDAALAELSTLRSQLANAFGERSTQVRNIGKQLRKLSM